MPPERSQEEWDRLHGCFADFRLKIPFVLALFQAELTIPRPIQQRALSALLDGENVVIEGPPGAGRSTAALIALLNHLDVEKPQLQAVCMTRTGGEVKRLHQMITKMTNEMRVIVGACAEDRDPSAVLNAHPHVLVATDVQLREWLEKRLLSTMLPTVRHFAVFELDAKCPASFVENMDAFYLKLAAQMTSFQTILVAERVTKQLLTFCGWMENDLRFVSLPGAGGDSPETVESRSRSSESSQGTERSESPASDYEDARSSGGDTQSTTPMDDVPPQRSPRLPTGKKEWVSSTRVPHAAPTRTKSPRHERWPTFDQLELRPELLKALQRMKVRYVLPIQWRGIPPLLAGRNAVICGPTGLGTAGVYLLPLLHRLDTGVGHVQAIVVCQKRSTVTNTNDVLRRGFGHYLRFNTFVCLGGEPVGDQLRKVRHGVHVMVGSVQGVMKLVESSQFENQSLRYVVFDEIEEALRTCSEMVHSVLQRLPANVQVVFVTRGESAAVDRTAADFLHDPLYVSAVEPKPRGEKKKATSEPAAPREQPADQNARAASLPTAAKEEPVGENKEKAVVQMEDSQRDQKAPVVHAERKEEEQVDDEEEEEDEEEDGPTEFDDVQAPNGPLATRLAAAQLRGQLLENRLKELRIYELEEKLGLAHGQPVDVLPPNCEL
ncbi:hypothetical protein M3Y99_00222200 [Aphelenchoides fujianensis]|nr:hypothetical protein M3Y99_00222200 [Aphelenchoides fujianensis]